MHKSAAAAALPFKLTPVLLQVIWAQNVSWNVVPDGVQEYWGCISACLQVAQNSRTAVNHYGCTYCMIYCMKYAPNDGVSNLGCIIVAITSCKTKQQPVQLQAITCAAECGSECATCRCTLALAQVLCWHGDVQCRNSNCVPSLVQSWLPLP